MAAQLLWIVSPRLTLTGPDDLKIFARVFYGYLHNPDLGLAKNPEIETIKLDGKELDGKNLTLGEIFYSRTAIVTRATMCRHAHLASQPSKKLILKSSWRYAERHSEGDLLVEATNAKVEGIAIYFGHKDQETLKDILGGVHITGTIPLRKYKRSVMSAVSQPSSKRTRSSAPALESKSSKHRKSSSNAPATELHATETEHEPEVQKSDLIIPDRIHTHLLISPGISITKFEKLLDLLRSMRDANRGHRSLLTKGGILHRDISINNIMLTDPSHPRPDGFHGFLIDLGLAVRVNRQKASGAPDRTGTYEFLSLDLLNEESGYDFHDELQSFYFVLIWLAHDHAGGKNFPEQWGGSLQQAAYTKRPRYFNRNFSTSFWIPFNQIWGMRLKQL